MPGRIRSQQSAPGGRAAGSLARVGPCLRSRPPASGTDPVAVASHRFGHRAGYDLVATRRCQPEATSPAAGNSFRSLASSTRRSGGEGRVGVGTAKRAVVGEAAVDRDGGARDVGRHRRQAAIATARSVLREPDGPAPAATLGPACGMIGGQVGIEVMHLLTGLAKPSTLGTAHIFDLRTMEIEREEVVPAPDCPVCSDFAPVANPAGR
jgi:hypothetical protein